MISVAIIDIKNMHDTALSRSHRDKHQPLKNTNPGGRSRYLGCECTSVDRGGLFHTFLSHPLRQGRNRRSNSSTFDTSTCKNTHTHTHTRTYVYIYIIIRNVSSYTTSFSICSCMELFEPRLHSPYVWLSIKTLLRL